MKILIQFSIMFLFLKKLSVRLEDIYGNNPSDYQLLRLAPIDPLVNKYQSHVLNISLIIVIIPLSPESLFSTLHLVHCTSYPENPCSE